MSNNLQDLWDLYLNWVSFKVSLVYVAMEEVLLCKIWTTSWWTWHLTCKKTGFPWGTPHCFENSNLTHIFQITLLHTQSRWIDTTGDKQHKFEEWMYLRILILCFSQWKALLLNWHSEKPIFLFCFILYSVP